jgi:type I restriction enzyme S subunit
MTDNRDNWSSAGKAKSSAGRGAGKKIELYGIKKLRELILELAVRGLLVAQDPNDEPAAELLNKIAGEKEKLLEDGLIRIKKLTIQVEEDEKPFQIPEGWEWTRLISVGHDLGQLAPETEFTYIDVGSINKELGLVSSPSVLAANEAPSRARKIVKKGTVIYSTVRPYLLNIAVVDQDFDPMPIASTAFAIIYPYEGVLASFIYRYLRSPTFVSYVESCQTGIAYPAINDKQFFSGLFPLPPLSEQQRIVAKVDELMALCDQLEHQQESSISAHQTLVQILLGVLTNGSDREGFAAAWARIAQHFDTLFTTEWSIDQLKQTILQLAVMGKLVPQNPNDEPANELLKKIAAEKAKLIKEGKIKKQKLLPPISDDEKPFELPEAWDWLRLGGVARLISGKGFKKSEYSYSGARLLQIANVSLGFTKWDIENYMPLTYFEKHPELKLYAGDILVALNRPLLNKRMKVCMLSESDLPAILYQRVGKFVFYGSNVSKKYFYYFMQSELFIDHLDENLQGSDQPFINQSQLVNFMFPLPPVREQFLIVSKIDELIAICETLKDYINTSQTNQLQLADTMTERALN